MMAIIMQYLVIYDKKSFQSEILDVSVNLEMA